MPALTRTWQSFFRRDEWGGQRASYDDLLVNGTLVVAVGQATETDSANAVTWAPKIRLLAQPSETDTALPLSAPKHIPAAQATETDSTATVTPLKSRTLSQATETDTANAVTIRITVVAPAASATFSAPTPVIRETLTISAASVTFSAAAPEVFEGVVAPSGMLTLSAPTRTGGATDDTNKDAADSGVEIVLGAASGIRIAFVSSTLDETPLWTRVG